MTIFDTRQMSSNEYNITHSIQVSSTNHHSFCIPSIHVKLYTFETFWTLHDPMTALTIAFSYHFTFSLTWFVLGIVSLWQSFPFIKHILSQTYTKWFGQSLLMSGSVLKAVYYWSVYDMVSVMILTLDCLTASVILEMMSLPLYFEDWPSILADPHCSG